MVQPDSLLIIPDIAAAAQPNTPATAAADTLALSHQTLAAIVAASEPSTTDQIQAWAAVIGAIVALFTLWKLVSRNKEHEAHIAQLSTIAESSVEQIKILSDQVEELRNHSDLMQSHLKVYEGMLDISSQDFSLKKADAEAKAMAEKQKQRQENLPVFELSSSGPKGENPYRFVLANVGKIAKKLRIVDTSMHNFIEWYYYPNLITADSSEPIKVESGSVFEVDAQRQVRLDGYVDTYKCRYNAQRVPFEVTLDFEDALGNQYQQKIGRPLGGGATIGKSLLQSINNLHR